MTDKELKRLKRAELLEMLIEQMKENAKLKGDLEKTQKALSDRQITISQAGSIADAVMQLSGVFEAAQDAAAQYLENIQRLSGEQETICQRMEDDARKKADAIRAEADAYSGAARAKADAIRAEADAYSQETRERADAIRAEADAYSEENRKRADASSQTASPKTDTGSQTASPKADAGSQTAQKADASGQKAQAKKSRRRGNKRRTK